MIFSVETPALSRDKYQVVHNSRARRPSPPSPGNARRPRGRPRAYDADQALTQARDAFWDGGYAGTSLDDLVAATGMNRPSLYGAFGDKHRLYLSTLERYRALGRAAMTEELSADRPLAEVLQALFARAITLYSGGANGARGCYLIGTAATEAVHDSEVRAVLAAGLHELDKILEMRLRQAQSRGELPRDSDPAALARVLCAVMNSLALRARAGDSPGVLTATAAAAVSLLPIRRRPPQPKR